ncbi:MAG TPA: ABC transporter permease [Minicystis sp.]|nr:ABC transporter permease [Minicystis sp.]
MNAALRRVKAVTHKEVLHMIRDARVVYLALGLPVLMLLLFGYGISTDVDHLPIAVVDHDGTRASRRAVEALVAGGQFDVVARASSVEATAALLRRGDVTAVLVVPPRYQRDLARGDRPTPEVLVDGSDGMVASIALGDATGALLAASASGARPPPLLARFNPAMRSAHQFVPGVIALILATVSSLLAGLTVAREWEQGSMEQLFATPVRRAEILVGKLVPYLLLGLLQTLLIVTVGSWLFDVPIRGSVALLFGTSALFLATMLGIGLAVSVITKSQLVSVQVATLLTMLPTTLLSGFIFPIDNMPTPLRVAASALPGRYYMTALRGVFLKGNGLAVLAPDVAALALFAAIVLGLGIWRFRRRLA